MDNLDYQILACLKDNSREKASMISRRINLSVSAVLERIRKLEQKGIIRGYTVVTDKRLLGLGLQAVMEVSLEHSRYSESFIGIIRSMPEVASCYYINGDFDFVLRIYAQDADDLENIHSRIKNIRGVAATKIYIALRTVKEEL